MPAISSALRSWLLFVSVCAPQISCPVYRVHRLLVVIATEQKKKHKNAKKEIFIFTFLLCSSMHRLACLLFMPSPRGYHGVALLLLYPIIIKKYDAWHLMWASFFFCFVWWLPCLYDAHSSLLHRLGLCLFRFFRCASCTRHKRSATRKRKKKTARDDAREKAKKYIKPRNWNAEMRPHITVSRGRSFWFDFNESITYRRHCILSSRRFSSLRQQWIEFPQWINRKTLPQSQCQSHGNLPVKSGKLSWPDAQNKRKIR